MSIFPSAPSAEAPIEPQLKEDTTAPLRAATKAARWLGALLIAATALTGVGMSTAASASATTGGCSNGRCTIYFNKAETRALAQGRAPGLPASAPWQIKVAYGALVAGHQWIAGQYANRGWCSAFRLTIYPWEGQGYDGYRC